MHAGIWLAGRCCCWLSLPLAPPAARLPACHAGPALLPARTTSKHSPSRAPPLVVGVCRKERRKVQKFHRARAAWRGDLSGPRRRQPRASGTVHADMQPQPQPPSCTHTPGPCIGGNPAAPHCPTPCACSALAAAPHRAPPPACCVPQASAGELLAAPAAPHVCAAAVGEEDELRGAGGRLGGNRGLPAVGGRSPVEAVGCIAFFTLLCSHRLQAPVLRTKPPPWPLQVPRPPDLPAC
jgi:hypothetical protein